MSHASKITLWILSSLLVLLFCLLAALPSWISTPSGTETVVKWVNAGIKGKLTVGKVDLNWVGQQRLENVSLVDESGNLVFSLRSFDTQTTLVYLLIGGRNLERTVIEEPYLFLSTEKAEKEKTAKKEGRSKSGSTWRFPTFNESLFVNNGTLVVAPAGITPITISQINIEKGAGTDNFHMSAQTVQGDMQGAITVDATFAKKIQAKINVQNFPLAVLDEWKGSPLFTEALGPTLSLEMNVEKEGSSSLSIHGSATSAHLSAYIEGVTEDHKFSLSPQTEIDFTLTPAFFKLLIDEEERKEWDLASKTQVKVHIEKGVFPLTLQQPDFQEILLQANLSIDRAELHHASLGSYSLKHFTGSIIARNNLEIAYEGEIQGKEQTKLSGTISITPEREVLFEYTYKGFPVTLLSLISSDLEKNVRMLFGGQFDMESRGTYIDGEIDAQVTVDSPLTHLTAQVDGELPELKFEIEGMTRIPPAKGKVIGDSLDFKLNGNAHIEEGELTIPFIKGNVSNPHLSFDLRGQIGEEGEPFTPETIQLIATGMIKQLPLLEGRASLENTAAFIQVDGSKNLIVVKGEGPGVDALVEVHGFVHEGKIAFDQANITFNTKLDDFPVDVITPFISETLDLSNLIGERLNLTARGSYTPQSEPRFLIDLNTQGEGFATSLNVALDGTLSVTQNKPSYIYWEISPQRYEALIRALRLDPTVEPTFILTHSTRLELNITQFSCPTGTAEGVGHFLCQSGFVGEIRLGPTIFRSKHTQETIAFQGVAGSIKGENFSEGIDLILGGKILAPNIPTSEHSSFAFDGQMLNFWTKEGHFNREGLTVKGVLSLDLVPVRQITGMAPLDPETREIMQAVLGELINARIYGEISQLSGPLTIDVKASNFKANLPLQLHQSVIYLRDFVDAEITLTEAVNETLLKDISPLFLAGAYSDNPLKLYIDPQGFMIPIHPYSLQGVQIGKATLDLGRIHIRNGGQVQYLMEFLQAKEISHDGWMEAWFTPIYFNLKDGIASYSRFDALLGGNIHIALWGSINLLNDNVRMTLAIAPTTLYQRFKISGLKRQDMFQVKMRGTTKKLEMDWSAAYTRIAFIIARTAGGQIGNIIGGLLEQLVTAMGDEPAPPPTTTPFPWEGQYSSEPATSNSRKGLRRLTEFLNP